MVYRVLYENSQLAVFQSQRLKVYQAVVVIHRSSSDQHHISIPNLVKWLWVCAADFQTMISPWRTFSTGVFIEVVNLSNGLLDIGSNGPRSAR